jgi:hypothetical protein
VLNTDTRLPDVGQGLKLYPEFFDSWIGTKWVSQYQQLRGGNS